MEAHPPSHPAADPAAWSHLPPAICAVVLAPDRSGRVLMVRRAKRGIGYGYWTPVTGRVEAGESLEQAVVREVAEEVGLHVRPSALVWRCPTNVHSHVLHWFFAVLEPPGRPVDGTLPQIVPAAEEIEAWRWVTPLQALELAPMFSDTRRFFAEYADAVRTAAAHA